MRVDILASDGQEYADLQIVDREEGNAYGLFLADGEPDEVYFSKPAAGLTYFEINDTKR